MDKRVILNKMLRLHSMKIRRATSKDFPAIVELIEEHPQRLLQKNLPRASAFFVAVESGTIVGCCALEVYSKRLAEIRSLAVTKKFQGKGIAHALIQSCLKLAKKKNVYEVLSITGASGLFEKYGFGTFNRERFALIKILGN